MLIGILNHIDGTETKFHMNTDSQFENTKDELEEFAVCANSPWSQANEIYTIKYNCKDGYTPKPENEPDWRCEYEVVGYERITSVIYGYGNTQQEALQNCMDLFERLQKEYNKEDESF